MRTKWKIVGAIAVLLLLIAITVQIFIDRWLEPVIRKRLETLIIPGSDSLYNFQLDSIRVNFWSGSVELQNLHVKVDSLHYAQREKAGNLPALTAEINLSKGSINNIRLLQLVFNKKISIGTILSKNTNITISRHFKKSKQKIGNTMNEPLWKLLQPDIGNHSLYYRATGRCLALQGHNYVGVVTVLCVAQTGGFQLAIEAKDNVIGRKYTQCIKQVA